MNTSKNFTTLARELASLNFNSQSAALDETHPQGKNSLNDLDDTGKTLLTAAALENLDTLVQTLLTRGADPNTQNANGETSLSAILKSDTLSDDRKNQLCRILVINGANPNIQDQAGQTPLMIAASMYSEYTFSELSTPARASALLAVDRGYGPRLRDMVSNLAKEPFGTPLIIGHAPLVNDLLSYCDPAFLGGINNADNQGNTALHYAAQLASGPFSMMDTTIEVILQKDAKHTPNNIGEYPEDLAKTDAHQDSDLGSTHQMLEANRLGKKIDAIPTYKLNAVNRDFKETVTARRDAVPLVTGSDPKPSGPGHKR